MCGVFLVLVKYNLNLELGRSLHKVGQYSYKTWKTTSNIWTISREKLDVRIQTWTVSPKVGQTYIKNLENDLE